MERYTDTITGEELYVKSGEVYKFYYKDKDRTIRHRIDGPSNIWSDGHKEWYANGKLHRLDGPAYESADGSKAWWVDGVFIMTINEAGKVINRMK